MYTRKFKKGGKYIAEGTYGCVFGNPPLKCLRDDKRKGDEYVSKLMSLRYLLEEYREGKKWNTIDPKQEFSITASYICKIDTNNIKNTNNLEKCSVDYDIPLKNRFLLFYKNGGPDLGKLKTVSKNYIDIFCGFQNLFDGLIIAHKNKLYHLDIKPANILSGEDSIVLRYIDFGLSCSTKDLKEFNDVYIENISFYPYWPFELGCFDNMGTLKSKEFIKKRFDTFNNLSRDFGLSRFDIEFETLYSSLKSNNFKDFDKVFEKVDIFSLGISLIDILQKYFYYFLIQDSNGEHILYYSDRKHEKHSRFETLKEKDWLSEKQLTFHLHMNEIMKPLVKFINKCVHYNPKNRYTAQEAAHEYRKLLFIFKEHFTQNVIRKGLNGLYILNEKHDIPIIETPEKEDTSPLDFSISKLNTSPFDFPISKLNTISKKESKSLKRKTKTKIIKPIKTL
jgi:serine/threonine protein kinase